MKFFFDNIDRELYKFYNEKTIREIRVVPGTPEIEADCYENEHSIWWPVYDPYGSSSCEPVECKDIDEAYEYLLEAMNLSAYEYANDL